jgi:oleate hydratase
MTATATPADSHAYLVGAGIATLSAAVFLIRDGHLRGSNVHILEQLPIAGGAMDGAGDPSTGYVARGGRMLTDETYTCLWNLLDTIPTLTDASMTVHDEIVEFNEKWRTEAKARIIGRDHTILDASALGLDLRDRVELTRLLAMPEALIGARRIEDLFSDHFFDTNFWCLWRTTFAFQNWHSAIELKRYLLRFIQEFPRIHTLAGVRRTRLNQYDSIIRPITAWLADRGVVFEHGVTVTDVDFVDDTARRAERLHFTCDGVAGTHVLGDGDYAFITLGSMTADSANGDDDHAPAQVLDKRDGSWRLWDVLSSKAKDFGRPNTFSGNIEESRWESFTLTMRSPALLRRIEEWTGNSAGSGGLMTFKDSPWLMSIVVPHQPHFDGQPDDVHTLWGYGLLLDRKGDFVDKTMPRATGQEILTELLGQLGWSDMADSVRASTTVIPVMMPYITSQFARRDIADRPLVVPADAGNFAFLGQFTEIPGDVVFTVEYSVRSAMLGVYELLGIDEPVPAIYSGLADPQVAIRALKVALA